jgi:hypothetical protein
LDIHSSNVFSRGSITFLYWLIDLSSTHSSINTRHLMVSFLILYAIYLFYKVFKKNAWKP